MSVISLQLIISAFGGVLLGGLLSWLLFLFDKYFERRRKHFNALVAVEYAISENLDTSSTNLSQMETFHQTLKDKQFSIPSFKEFNLPKNTIYDLQSQKFINDVFELCLDMERVNRDMLGLFSRYQRVLDRVSALDINNRNGDAFNEYAVNANGMATDLSRVVKFAKNLDGGMVEVLAKSRVLSRHRPRVIDTLIAYLSKGDTLPGSFSEQVLTEKTIIEKERVNHKLPDGF